MSSTEYNVESPRSFLYTHSGLGAASIERIRQADAAGLTVGTYERGLFLETKRAQYDESFQGQSDLLVYKITLSTLEQLETKYTLTPKETKRAQYDESYQGV